ncbi:type IX secretion system sortase PorU [Hymenobacter caeli]|uniref:Gingipain domain-containing protein n=1 Tax=Hymenobacter caeli TaxID=2735894 RepID=A0ABX2FTP9_9BACT|nr:type IX secretion system sortase PorU [Hymenobacter caeli]NRT20577.1 hypothetical protein [Hymenobacter caeli]
MRRLLLLLVLVGLGYAPARAQGGAATAHAALRWGGYTEVPSRTGRTQRVPTFAGAWAAFDEQVGTFSLRLSGDVREGQLLNPVYEAFSDADAKLFDLSKLPAGPVVQLTPGTETKLPITRLSLRPVRRNPQTGQAERLVSFDFSYSPEYGRATGARGGSGGTTRAHAPHSVLASGDWYKLGVPANGIYKIDQAKLKEIGFNPATTDPKTLRLYGNAAGLLPQANAAYRPDDLVENAVLFKGNGDNAFDADEYLLFYAPGPNTWYAENGRFRHVNNIYADTAYYFLTTQAAAAAPRRVATAGAPGAAATRTVTTFDERAFYEHDLVNLLHSGRQWLGESFSGSVAPPAFALGNLPDLVPGSTAQLTLALAANDLNGSQFQASLNGTAVGTVPLAATTGQQFYAVATLNTVTLPVALPAAPPTAPSVDLAYTTNSGQGVGYLDYLELNAQRRLTLSGPALEFRSLASVGPRAVSRFVLAGTTAATAVWDVTNPRRAVAQALDGSGAFAAATDTLREYVAFQPDGAFATPRAFGKVPNQDLHALDGSYDLVIVTYPAFREQANRLADHRRTHDGLKVAVATTKEVYNEFGSGGQDATAIRDFMKQVYDRAPAGKAQYLLLFGDASFDYKSSPYNDKSLEAKWWPGRAPFKTGSDFDAINQNYVPTYESRESLTQFYGNTVTYSSEDYYGLLDDDEGDWNEYPTGTEVQDVAVGRLPVRTPKGQPANTDMARRMVDKLIAYDAAASFGKWRNRLSLWADDGNNDLFVGQGSEPLAASIQATAPNYNVHKVYLDLYPQVSVAAGLRSPEANKAVDESFEGGSLLINYLGHGGPSGLSDEQIFTNASALALQNHDRLAFLVTGTCDLSTYDNPDFTSAGEQVLTDNLNGGGAVGLFTTTRVVEAFQNAGLNQEFYNNVFRPLSNGKMPAIGTVTMLAKNAYPGPGAAGILNNRNYTLLGDPSMTLAYPRQTAEIDSLNKKYLPGGAAPATLQALAAVRLHGRVLNAGALSTAFNGTAQVTIYDKPATVQTLGSKYSPATPADGPRPVQVQESVIYSGQATVTGGQFSLRFVVPKDINYNVGIGKISLYAFSSTTDAGGRLAVPVGGAATGAARDTIPPVVALFMDSETFAFGGLTGQNTTLLADLSDNSGINTTGAGIGHEITAVLDNDPTKLTVLNDAYVGKVDNFRAGQAKYLYKDLTAGPHTLKVKAWDTYNNSAEREIEFVVAHTEQLALSHVLNYPNPFASATTFHFDQNREGDDLDVQVQIFTVSGKLVRTLTASIVNSEPHQKSITWDGRDEYHDQLARGVYVYRVSVRAQSDRATASKFEKLVILN